MNINELRNGDCCENKSQANHLTRKIAGDIMIRAGHVQRMDDDTRPKRA